MNDTSMRETKVTKRNIVIPLLAYLISFVGLIVQFNASEISLMHTDIISVIFEILILVGVVLSITGLIKNSKITIGWWLSLVYLLLVTIIITFILIMASIWAG